ncbi:Chitinase 2 [Kalmusia sp. IMI 367209]|nr:Chitinase 2 [Kalmusia sp. IMI 367209]
MFARSLVLCLLAATVSATFDASSSSNVAIYWGQGSEQLSLKEVCSDPSIDIVNMAFVNQFPRRRGEYPSTNFGQLCPQWDSSAANTGKVLLSIGGGYPIDYFLETQDIAEYLADFLWGAFGPPDDDWKAQGKPRPFGDQYVDGFDLDLEALMDPIPFQGYQYLNYHYLVSRWKNVLFPSKTGNFYISSAPQCVVPDIRLADAISQSHFDFIFAQFYNTASCSARRGYEGLSTSTTSFTFDQWVDWLKVHSTVNPNVKLYLGLPADSQAVPSDPTAYLSPMEANDVISFYKAKYLDIFGGIMLWEATISSKNTHCDKTYSAHIKSILKGSYVPEICPTTASSSVASTSSAVAIPTAISLDGICGPASGNTCIGSTFGYCCSQYNYCGSTELYCGTENCNPLFGNCGVSGSSISMVPTITGSAVASSSGSIVSRPTSNPSPNGRCGAEFGGYDCTGYFMGECCSEYGYCGGLSAYCDAGCQPDFGKCTGTVSSSEPSTPFPTITNSSIHLSTGTAQSVVTSTTHAPFPTNASSTSRGASTGTGNAYITSVSAPCNSSSGHLPTGTGSNSVSIPATTGASSSIPGPPMGSLAPYPIFNGSDDTAFLTTSSVAGGYPVYTGPSYPVNTPGLATYGNACPTGFTTVTAAVTKSYAACPKCAPILTSIEVPAGWTTFVTVCGHCGPKTTTVTLTKPIGTATEAPYQGAHPSPARGAPPYRGAPSLPAGQPQSSGKGGSVPVAHPTGESYVSGTADLTVSVTSKMYMTVIAVPASEVPGAATTPAAYVASNSTYVSSGWASRTGKGTAYTTSAPRTLYEGAASRFSVGMGSFAVLVAAALHL